MSISERTQLADYMNLIKLQLPTQSISLTLSMQKSKYTTYLSQVTDKCCTLTLKYSNIQLYLQHLLQMVETFTGTPLICAMSSFSFSVCVIVHQGHHQSHKANSMNMPVLFRGLMSFTVFDSKHQPWLWLLGLLGGSHVWMEPLKVAKFSQLMFQFSWNSAEASSYCCLCSLSSTPLPGVQVA